MRAETRPAPTRYPMEPGRVSTAVIRLPAGGGRRVRHAPAATGRRRRRGTGAARGRPGRAARAGGGGRGAAGRARRRTRPPVSPTLAPRRGFPRPAYRRGPRPRPSPRPRDDRPRSRRCSRPARAAMSCRPRSLGRTACRARRPASRHRRSRHGAERRVGGHWSRLRGQVRESAIEHRRGSLGG